MKQAVIPYADDLPAALQLTERDFVKELTFLAAAKLYELGRLSAGQAAGLAQMDRLHFLEELRRVDVPAINLLGDEVSAEVAAARDLAG